MIKWKENLIALREKSGLSYSQIAHGVDRSESTVKRVFSKKQEDCKGGHTIEVIIDIIHFMGGKVIDIFEDTGAKIFDNNVNELQEKIIELEKERDSAIADNNALKTEVTALTNEIMRIKIDHKDEIIELYKLLYKSKNTDSKGEL